MKENTTRRGWTAARDWIQTLNLNRGERILCRLAAALVLTGVVFLCVPGIRFLQYPCWELAAVCLLWIALNRWAKRSKTGVWVRRLFRAGLSAIVLVLVCCEIVILRYAAEDWSALASDALIVLGAGIEHGKPSLALQTRLDRAEAYLTGHPDIPAVLTGGQGLGEDVPEGDVMYAWFTGVHPEWADRLLTENRATSTAENYVYARELLEADGIDTDSAVIAVVTNGFHMYRARLLAERLGLHTLGIPAQGLPWWVNTDCTVREAFALVKTVLFDWEAVIPDRS